MTDNTAVDMMEMGGPEVLLVTIGEFRGPFPDVPLAPDIDLEGIKQGDADPFFVTLPIARVGATGKGRGKLTYGESANQSIVSEVMAKKPEGRKGHIKDENRETEYNLPAINCYGAMTDQDGITWGKFYVPKYQEDVRQYYRDKMRANARAAVSLYGRAWADKSGLAHRVEIESIDIADPERAGLPVASVPIITSNMAGDDPGGQETNVSEEVLVRELTESRDKVKADLTLAETKIAEMETRIKTLEAAEPRAVKMAEMATLLGVEVDAVPVKVAEMQAQLATFQTAEKRQKVEAKIADLVKEPLQSLRSVVVAHMGAVETWPTEDDKIKAAVEAILDKPDVKQIAEMMVKAVGGGSIALGTADQTHAQKPDLDKLGRDEAARTGMTRTRH